MEVTQKKETYGGDFIIHNDNLNSIFTPEDFNEEQLMMRDSVKDFIDREVWPYKDRFEKKDYDFTKKLMQKAGELGFLSVSIPEEYGGMGMDFVSTMLAVDYVSGTSGSVATAYGAHTGIAILPIYLFGNEDQKQKY